MAVYVYHMDSAFTRRRGRERFDVERQYFDSHRRPIRGRNVAVRQTAPCRHTTRRPRGTRFFQPPPEQQLRRSNTSGGSSFPGYEFVKSLTTGGFSDAVTLVKKSGKLFITKHVPADKSQTELMEAELIVLKNLKHSGCRNLNKLVDYKWGPQKRSITFLLEYCDAGSLQDIIKSYRTNGGNVSREYAYHLLLGMANALAFLHHGIRDPQRDRRNDRWDSIYHLDLKPQNIFLSAKDQRGRYPRVVVGDFGCAVTKSDIRSGKVDGRRQPCGTPGWYPPEGQRDERYGCESDIWAMGLTIHVLCRKLGMPDPRQIESSSPCGSQYGNSLNSIVQQCLHRDWRKRPTAADVARQVQSVVRRKGLRL